MERYCGVGLCQMEVCEDKAENRRRAGEQMERCAAGGAQVIVLPEMFCCPYSTDAFARYAEEAEGETWTFLADTARRLGVYLFGGSLPERAGSRLYNTMFIFDDNGRQIGRHRKVHLFDIRIRGGQWFRESDSFTAGDDVTVVETPFGKFGAAICFDLRFPELFRLMALRGAVAAVLPAAFNMTTGPAHWSLSCRARALDNQMYLLACEPARNPTASYIAYGHSLIAGPWGDVQEELDERPGTLVRTIDLHRTAEVRDQLPLLKARRTDLY